MMLTDRLKQVFRSDDEKIAEADEIISLLKDSPTLDALQRERDERRLGEIRSLLAKREQLQKKTAATLPGLQAAVLEAQEVENRAHDAWLAASRERVNIEYERLTASLDSNFAIGEIERQIMSLAPHEIDDFLCEMMTRDEKARRDLKVEQRRGPEAVFTGNVQEMIFTSNTKAVASLRECIKRAVVEAQALKFAVIPFGEVISRLDAIKKGLPDADRFETVDLPFPDVQELRRNLQ